MMDARIETEAEDLSRASVSELAPLLDNRQWGISTVPFPHLTAEDVFCPWVYERLETAFQEILARGLSEKPRHDRFSRLFKGYDAYAARLDETSSNPLSLFSTPEWCDLLAGCFNLSVTAEISVELHHHAAGSRNGSIHNDFNPGFFLGGSSKKRINLSDSRVCHYKTGRKADGDERPTVQRVRAIACLYYLANDAWRPGDGGETGLYSTRDSRIEQPAATVAPRNNSLLAFPITPYSFHSFLSNVRQPRNAIVMWLHRTLEDAVDQWGFHAISQWH